MVEYKDFIIGALLHDIGKAIIENGHNLHVYDYEKHQDRVERLKKILNLNEKDIIWHCIVYHHFPEKSAYKDYKDYLEIIKKADQEASELRLEEEAKSGEKKIKIIHPWSIISGDIKNIWAYSLLDLIDESKILLTKEDISLEEYRKIWIDKYQPMFLEELKKALNSKNPDTILAVLYKWLYFFPETSESSRLNLFSLAFHLKTTAMLADLYYKREKEGKKVYVIFIDFVGTHNTILSFLRKKKEFIEEEGGYLKKVNYLSRFIDAFVAYVTRKILSIANSYTTNILYISGSSAKVVVAIDSKQEKLIKEEIEKINKKLFSLTLGNGFILLHFEKVEDNLSEGLLESIVKAAFLNEEVEYKIEEEKIEWLKKLSKDYYEKNVYESHYNKIKGFLETIKQILEDFKIILPKDLYFEEEEPLIIPFEYLLEIDNHRDKDWLIFSPIEKIFIYLESGRLRGTSIDDIEDISKIKKVGFLKIDGDMVGKLFTEIFPSLMPDLIQRLINSANLKKEDINRNIYSLLILKLSEYLSLMFKYKVLLIAKRLNDRNKKNDNKYRKAISVVYNSGDELLAIGDIELLLEFYKDFLKEKEKLLENLIKTSAAFTYIHYKSPFNFAYQEIRELPDNIKSEKEQYRKIKELNRNLWNISNEREKLEIRYKILNMYKDMEDGIMFLRGKILFRTLSEFEIKYYLIKRIIDSVKNGDLPRTRISNTEILLERSIEELDRNKVSSIIYLVYYVTKEKENYVTKEKESNKILKDLIEEIKNNFKLGDIKKTKDSLYYWLSILDYVKSVTR